MEKTFASGLVWFRRDLRVDDNAALQLALKSCRQVHCDFVFDREIFSWIKEGEELVDAPFRRLAAAGKLAALKHNGFWNCMDTYKEKQTMDDLVNSGNTPWQVWKQRPAAEPAIHLPPLPLVMSNQPIG